MNEILQALAQGFLVGSTYGMLALGMGLVYSVSGLVNFAHGDFVLLGMYLCFALASAFALDPYVSVLITMPLMMVVGGATYYFFIRPIAGHHMLMVIQLTLGISLLIQNGLLMSFGGQYQRTPSALESKLLILGDVVVRMPHVVSCLASFGIAVGLYILLRATDVGRAIRAVHQNPKAASLMGIDVGKVRWMTFAAGIGLK
jgi:branched-chain amino acid transport system permease protein